MQAKAFDLSRSEEPLSGAPFDIAYSLEVAEHIPASLSDALVRCLTRTGKIVVLTAAPPGQGGQGHINEQPQSYWIAKFEAEGWRVAADAVDAMRAGLRERGAAGYLHRNLMVYRPDAAE